MDTTLMAAIALPALTLITYWIVIYFRRRKNDPMQHHGSKESHQKVANGSEVGTNVFAQKQHQHQQHQHQQHQHQQHQQHQHQQQQQRNQKGGGTPAATANKARHNNNANHTVTSSGNNNKRYDKEQTFNHPWLASTLKGHTKDIRDLDFSSNGKFLASCAEDRTILIWATAQFEESKNRICFRISTEYDSGTKLSWNPDSNAIAINRSLDNAIEIYKFEKVKGWFSKASKLTTFSMVTHADIIGFGMACTGRYIMSCNNETNLYIWDLKGNLLETIDTYLMNNYSAKVSPCGRFIAVCGFAPDCKVYEVKFSRSGEYQKTVRAYSLSGHTSGIYDVAFDQDASHVATVSKDGSWRLYFTNVEYDKGQSPRCIKSGKYTPRSTPALIALSLNSEVIAIASGKNIEIFNMFSAECDASIKNVFPTYISCLSFDTLGKYVLASGGNRIRIFHNVTGYRATIDFSQIKLKTVKISNSTRDRIIAEANECKEFIKKIESKPKAD